MIEQDNKVMWPRACFGVPLKTKGRPIGELKPLQRPIEQRDMRCARIGRQGFGIDGKAMILCRDKDPA